MPANSSAKSSKQVGVLFVSLCPQRICFIGLRQFGVQTSEVLGEPGLLKRSGQIATGISDLASRLGYQSKAAFSRAFKRFIGISPGAARRTADVAYVGNKIVTTNS